MSRIRLRLKELGSLLLILVTLALILLLLLNSLKNT